MKKKKLISIFAFLTVFLTVFIISNTETAEASEIVNEYVEEQVFTYPQTVNVETNTTYETIFGSKSLVDKRLVQSNPTARYNVYEYLYKRDVMQRPKYTTTITKRDVFVIERYLVTVYANGNRTRTFMNKRENYSPVYTVISSSYGPYTLISQEYISEYRNEYY